MSEPQEDWKAEIRKIVKSELLQFKPETKELPPSSNPHETHNSLEALLGCKDCYPPIKQGVLEREILSRKDKPYVCVECGTRVDEEEENCPTCGGKDARER